MDDKLIPLRHSAAHVMAQAVTELYPGTKLGFGPAIEDGFYYDFELPRAITPDDLPAIEARMKEIIKGKHPFTHAELTIDAARARFAAQPFKLNQVHALASGEMGEHGEAPAKPATSVSTYTHDSFTDLCRGPHVATTGDIPADALKLLSIAGAYWRGDEKNPQLTRVYGTLWQSKQELDDYLWRLEEAKKRDNRKLGRELGLFYFSDDVGPGLPLFTPKGEIVRYLMEEYVREAQTKYGYQHVWTGHMVKEDLYHKSGHYDNYRDSMFPPMEDAGVVFRLKPMNCPSHMTLFNEMGKHSYREFPLRLA